MSRQPHNNPAPRSISHAEAEELLSARLDAPIDPYDNRALLWHLQTCQSCKVFAIQMEVMARELEALPRLPASPVVRREVHDRIQAPLPFWSRLATSGAHSGPGRALPAALAAMILLVAVTTWVLVELTNSGNGGTVSTGGSISAPGEIAVLISPTATETRSSTVLSPVESVEPSPTARVIDVPTRSATLTDPGAIATRTPTSESGQAPDEPVLAQALPSATTESAAAAQVLTPDQTATAVQGQGSGPAESTTPEVAIAAAGLAEEEATETATSEPSNTPAPSATFTPSTEPTATAEPSAAAASEPSATATVEPTSTPTTEPTSTWTPEPTQTAEPTFTPTVTPTETATPEPTFTPTVEPTATWTPEPTQTETPVPTETATPEPTGTATPTPSPTPSEAPEEVESMSQPTIAPRSGETSEIEGQGSASIESASVTEEPESDNGSPPIAPADGQPSEGEQSPEAGNENVTATTEAFGGQTALLLDSAPVLADLGGGVSAPSGRLEFRQGLDLFCVTLGDGSLGVASQSGEILASLGAGVYPAWSPQGLVLLYGDVSSGSSRVMTWDVETGVVHPGGAESDRTYSDTPAGWSGSRYYYQRTFPESPGEIEFHSASWDGSDDQTIWTSTDVVPVTSRPAATDDGFLIATNSRWILITTSGDAQDVGSNPYGSIGVVLVSPYRTLISYTVGGEIVIAPVNGPGSAMAVLPFTGGYDFSSSGEQIVISNGSTLELYSIYGEYLGSASGSAATGPPYWSDDTIYYLELGGSTTLRAVSASEILAS